MKELKRADICLRGDTVTLEDYYLKELLLLIESGVELLFENIQNVCDSFL